MLLSSFRSAIHGAPTELEVEINRVLFYKYFAPDGAIPTTFLTMNILKKLAFAILICLTPNLAPAQKQNDQEDESSRQIVLDRFNKARPLSEASAGVGGSSANTAAIRPPVYRRTGAMRIPARRGARLPSTEEIGI